jgi:hypothetical protein
MKWSDQTIIDDYSAEIIEYAKEHNAEKREDKIECIIKILRKHKQDLCIPTLNWNYLLKNIQWSVEECDHEPLQNSTTPSMTNNLDF